MGDNMKLTKTSQRFRLGVEHEEITPFSLMMMRPARKYIFIFILLSEYILLEYFGRVHPIQ